MPPPLQSRERDAVPDLQVPAAEADLMERVVVTRGMVGICHMAVCIGPDVADDEILRVCNRENPSGTSRGWTVVIRTEAQAGFFGEHRGHALPMTCADDPSRKHLLVGC